MPSKSKAQQHLMGAAHALQTGEASPSSSFPKAVSLAKSMKPSDTHDFASTKTHGLPVKKSSQERLALASYLIKVADVHGTLAKAEQALHKVHETRHKAMQDYAKNLKKQNDGLQKEVANASAAAQSASDAAQKVQASSAQAMQMQPPGAVPPAAQPAFGAMAVSPAEEGNQGQQPKMPQIPKVPGMAG